jgi:anaerobic C4-dicarboxylate transporter
MQTHNLGYPRIGSKRELKKACEQYWSGKISVVELIKTAFLIALAGIFILKKINPQRVIAGALTSTAIFFLVSNFGCWIGNTSYAQDLGGLMTCYVAGIPFLKGTLLGDLFYSGVLFGMFALAQKQFPVLQLKNA